MTPHTEQIAQARTCSIGGCDNKHRAKGLCHVHYARLLRHGSTESMHRTGCSIEGCERKHQAQGYCAAHWRSLQKTGDPLALVRVPRDGCEYPGCGGDHVARGFCSYHYELGRRMRSSQERLEQKRYLPIEPLRLLVAAVPVSRAELSQRAGLARETLERIINARHRLQADTADKIAHALGLHPVLIWGDDWIDWKGRVSA